MEFFITYFRFIAKNKYSINLDHFPFKFTTKQIANGSQTIKQFQKQKREFNDKMNEMRSDNWVKEL